MATVNVWGLELELAMELDKFIRQCRLNGDHETRVLGDILGGSIISCAPDTRPGEPAKNDVRAVKWVS